MSIKESLDRAGNKAEAEEKSIEWVHDQRVIEHEEEVIQAHERSMAHHEEILAADQQLENGVINRMEDAVEKDLIDYDKKVIADAEAKIEEEKQKQAEHQEAIDQAKKKVEG